MKQLPFIIVVVAVLVAYVFVWKKEPQGPPAAKEPVKELTLEEKIVGAYEFDNERSQQIVVFHDSGKMESYENGKKEGKEFRWKVVGGEVHAEYKDGYGSMWRIEPNGSLMHLGPLAYGKRHYLPRIPHYQPYWKKIPNYKEKIRRAKRLKILLQEAVEIEAAIRKTLKKPEGELTMADLGKVTRLSFYNEQISDMFVFKELIQLKSLMLQICKISDVSALKELTQLKELYLNGNAIRDVSALKELTQLTQLDLSGNKLTSVKGLDKLTQLKVLDLESNEIRDVSALKELTQLKLLSLSGNPDLTKAQIDQLQKALPKCKITHDAKK